MMGLVTQFHGIGYRPEEDDRFDDEPDRCTLGNDQQAWTGLDSRQVIAKVTEHGPAIMRHQNSVVLRRPLQEFRIADAVESGLSRRGEINRGLLPSNSLDNRELEIVIRLEANTQLRDSPILALARWIFSQSAGFAWAMGIPLDSNSRSVSSRYLSISAWWSK